MFMNLKTLDWDDELLTFFGVKRDCLAQIVSNAEVYGKMSSGALEGVSIAGLIGDQQGALAGQKCLVAGEAKNTYGTGCFMLYHTGKDVVKSNNGLLTTVGCACVGDWLLDCSTWVCVHRLLTRLAKTLLLNTLSKVPSLSQVAPSSG